MINMKFNIILRSILTTIFIVLPIALRADESPLASETLYGVTTPPLRSRAEVDAVLAAAPQPQVESALRPLTILIAGGAKDHFPKTHSHDRLLDRWKVLVGGKGPDDEPLVNMYRPQVDFDGGMNFTGLPKVKVLTTLDWPTAEQFASVDVMFFYQHPGCWNSLARIKQMEAYVDRGGGLVLSHYVLWNDDAELVNLFGLAMQKRISQYKHKEVALHVPSPVHPIMLGLPDQIVFADEVYWNFIGDRTKVTELATSDEMVENQLRREPVIWTYERGKGRVVASTLGHFDWTFDDPLFRTILLRAMAWAAGDSPYRFDPIVLRGIPLLD